MDPYKTPPQSLKDIFKELRIIKNTDDPDMTTLKVLDFGIPSASAFTASLDLFEKPLDCLQSHRHVTDPIALGTTSFSRNVHTVNDFPGIAIFSGILPPTYQRVLLDKLLHRDLSNHKHQTNLHLHYNVSYPDHANSFFATSPSDVFFKPKDPNLHKALNMEQVLQKKMRWMTLGGQYDWTNKVYSPEPAPQFPADISNLIRGLFNGMLDPQAAIVNIYSPGDTLSLHRDVSEVAKQPLVSVSLGCECIFLIAVEDTTADNGFKHTSIRLRFLYSLFDPNWSYENYADHESFTVMNEARFAWHGVPKIFPDSCPSYLASWPSDAGLNASSSQWDGWMKNKRINLNVRQIY